MLYCLFVCLFVQITSIFSKTSVVFVFPVRLVVKMELEVSFFVCF